MEGIVVKSMGLWCRVRANHGQVYSCRVRGKLRLSPTEHSNPIAVGDRVAFNLMGQEGIVVERLPRRNLLSRKAVGRKGHSHVLGANIDQVMLMATLEQPITSTGFIDRILVTAESFRIAQYLVFNKSDLLSALALSKQEKLLRRYATLGVKVDALSLAKDNDLGRIVDQLRGQTTLLVGLSGVGKSTFLNRTAAQATQPTQEISPSSQKGMHTTTYAEMFCIDTVTFIIDSPGLKEWGMVNMEKEELSDYFPEMRARRLACRYGARCLHIQEPACAIRKAVEEGSIDADRYKNYLNLVEGKDSRA